MNSTTGATQARLQRVVKQSRDIMRRDAGMNGELDRLPQLAWLLFLKAFDDLEAERAVLDDNYEPVVPDGLQWRTWATAADTTGDPFLTFVNDTLLPGLRGLRGESSAQDARDTFAVIFQDMRNKMLSGHLLRQLVDQVDSISFSSGDDLHTMAVLYESMLKEMRDAAGDSGEFYTPRPLIRFIVQQVDPQVGETVMDPAVGTGGFLTETYRHLTSRDLSVHDQHRAQQGLRGFEKKPLPFLLSQMNLLLQGIAEPRIILDNSLNHPLSEVRADGVDVVLTNPPFGGEEEKTVQQQFPKKFRTSETAWLFLLSVMSRLDKSPTGRCGIVVPNSVLFDTGVGAKIKEHLMQRYNLHTVLRLPNGVFAPYTIIPSNVLFFEKGTQGPVWFYEITAPDGRKNYTKTKPMREEEFEDCVAWWGGKSRERREENAHAWKMSFEEVKKNDYDLDSPNPIVGGRLEQLSSGQIVQELVSTERDLLRLMERIERQIEEFSL